MSNIPSKLDFTVCFANVNGSGSASANTLFAKCIFRMGCAVGIKNIFPSNIQGLPTWFEVRVSPEGHLGRSGIYDIMVGMNINTLARDIESLTSGGYFLFDSSLFLDTQAKRSDIKYLGIPIKNLAAEVFPGVRQRILLQNLIYVGALFSLLNMPPEVLETELKKQFNNEKIYKNNLEAFYLGYNYGEKEFPAHSGFKVSTSDKFEGKILIDGNTALALGCIAAGATVAAWYPITPSTSMIDAFSKYAEKYRTTPEGGKKYAIVQAEDEISAIGIVLGAAWNGARSFTATSGPGLSLMTEFLGYAFYAEIPIVLFDIQRCSPSTGLPTRTQQSDILFAAYASHGDTKHILLFPKNPAECFDFAIQAFEAADRYQTPVIVMSDIDIGMNLTLSSPLKLPKDFHLDRGKVLDAKALEGIKNYGRYEDVDGDGIPYRTIPGTHPKLGAYTSRGSGHDKMARYTEDSFGYKENLDRVFKKIAGATSTLPKPETRLSKKANKEFGVIYLGSTAYSMDEVITVLDARGHYLNYCRICSFPFHQEIKEFILDHKQVFVVEQNALAQIAGMLTFELQINPSLLRSLLYYDGKPTTAQNIVNDILAQLT